MTVLLLPELADMVKHPAAIMATLFATWIAEQTFRGFPEKVFEEWHRKLDTRALRIAPNELHISDVHLYKIIYHQTSPYLKHSPFYDCFQVRHSLFAEANPARHRERRKLLNPLLSRSGIVKLEPLIREKINRLGDKIRRLHMRGPINVSNAIRSATVDIISQFTFTKPLGLLDESPDSFDSAFLDAFDVATIG
ncbi:hypothetical protein VTN77DRAFT_4871 [Rasamsonia byssochlamydoides]|uniref:uncharacterized protein n=1 Tax=Rasamsonia byssochlamydoides TaxID=89139 RepID=UPI003744564E